MVLPYRSGFVSDLLNFQSYIYSNFNNLFNDTRSLSSCFGCNIFVLYTIYNKIKNEVSIEELLGCLYHLKNNTVFSSIHKIFNNCYKTFFYKFYNTLRILNNNLENFNFNNRFENFNKKKAVLSLIDGTEINILKPINDQKIYYSGKKKKHTVKFIVICDNYTGKILYVSDAFPGSFHDIKCYRLCHHNIRDFMFEGEKMIGDKGFYASEFNNFMIKPFKNADNDEEKILLNYLINRERVTIERVFQRIKKYNILKLFRYQKFKINLIFNVILKIFNIEIIFNPLFFENKNPHIFF
jgi:hypothetical protein